MDLKRINLDSLLNCNNFGLGKISDVYVGVFPVTKINGNLYKLDNL